jgi:tRNA-2-methylthio-N6-dimethylallyladenosine synthase
MNKTRIVIVTFGCQMNEYDIELVRSILTGAGHQFIDDETKADVILLNTCSVRDNAHRKVFGHIYEILHSHKDTKSQSYTKIQGHKPIIGILGCMATTLREKLFENEKLKIDFIAGPDSYKRLPEILEKLIRSQSHKVTKSQATDNERQTGNRQPATGKHQQQVCDVSLSEFETYGDIIPKRVPGVNAWVAVMRGCDNFCSFCVVPYARGRERSRSVENVLEEIHKAAGEDFKQVTLLGQNVNSYQDGKKDFADLLTEAAKIDGISRIRFMSPHPKDFPPKLLDTIAAEPKICRHIHLPVQAGSNRILKLMNRGYTRKDFLDLAAQIRQKLPTVALTTDIIVGFPTETDEEFKDTEALVKEVEFDSAFIFKYCERPHTLAAKKYPDDVLAEKKTERIVGLNALQKSISQKKNRAHLNETHEVLLEEQGTSRSPKDFQGRIDNNKLVIFPQEGRYSVGDIVRVKITDASAHVLKGMIS